METKKFMELVKKGKVGEKIVKKHLLEEGNIIYETNYEELDDKYNKSHPFDYMIYNKFEGMKIIEVKTVSSRKYYPDTGINYVSYQLYKEISKQYNMPYYIYFVDKNNKQIYGNLLSELETPYIDKKYGMYPKIIKSSWNEIDNTIIYFPLAKMKLLKELTIEDLKEAGLEIEE